MSNFPNPCKLDKNEMMPELSENIGIAARLMLVSEKTAVGRTLSGPLVATLLGLMLRNAHVLPGASPAYGVVNSYLLPLAIPLLLFNADMRRVVRDTGRVFGAFVIGAAATVAATFVALLIVPLKGLGADSWKVAAALMARHIGGAVNYVAVADALSISPTVLAAGLAADNVICILYFATIFAIPLLASDPFFKPSSRGLDAADGTAPRGPTSLGDTLPSPIMRGYGLALSTIQGGEGGAAASRNGNSNASSSGLGGSGRAMNGKGSPSSAVPSAAGGVAETAQVAGADGLPLSLKRAQASALRTLQAQLGPLADKPASAGIRGDDASSISMSGARSNGSNVGPIGGSVDSSVRGDSSTTSGAGNRIGGEDAARGGPSSVPVAASASVVSAGERSSVAGSSSNYGHGGEDGRRGDGKNKSGADKDGADMGGRGREGSEAPTEGKGGIMIGDLSFSIFIACGLCWLSQQICAAVGRPGGLLPVVTGLTVILATAFPTRIRPLATSAEGFASLLMHLFFASIGVAGDVRSAFGIAPGLFVFCFLQVAIHLGMTLAVGSWFGYHRSELLVASNANVGGPSTASGMAVAKGWTGLMVPGVLLGVAGYACATFIALVVAKLALVHMV
eukprot:jgi/Mesvir1/29703/Mv00936-RA.1